MKAFLHLNVNRLSPTSGANELTTYRFDTHTARHHFGRPCGVHAFSIPRPHPDKVDVNVRCLDGVDPTMLLVTRFDGRHSGRAAAARRDAG